MAILVRFQALQLMNATAANILSHLTTVYPQCRTMKEIQWWCGFDAIRNTDIAVADIKEAIRHLKKAGLIEYVDPLGWRAMETCANRQSSRS